MTWILENLGLLVELLFALLGLASVVTALTPTPKDDEWLRRIADFLSFLRPSDQKGTLKLPGVRSKPLTEKYPELLAPRRPPETPLIVERTKAEETSDEDPRSRLRR